MYHRKFVLLLTLLIASGCAESRKIANVQELRSAAGTNLGRISVLTRDSGLYRLEYYLIEDSVLSGSGTL